MCFNRKPIMKKCVWLSLSLAFVLWYIMFVLRPLNFWLMMSSSTTLLSGITLVYGSLKKSDLLPTWKDAAIGIASAAALYGVFFLGNQVLWLTEKWFPILMAGRSQNLSDIYANRGSLAPGVVAAVLFFPIGFGEEFFWRGFVQKQFSEKGSTIKAFLMTTALYAAVHLSTGNPVLLLAALACGVFWGGLYALTGRLPAVLISHMIWDPLIFILFPIQ